MNTKIIVAVGIGVAVGYFISNYLGMGQFTFPIPDHKPMPTKNPDGTPMVPRCNQVINPLNAPLGYLPPFKFGVN